MSMSRIGLACTIMFAIHSLQIGHAAKIAVVPLFGKSHVHVLNVVAEELLQRGHEVRIAIEKVNVMSTIKTHIDIYTVEKPFDEDAVGKEIQNNMMAAIGTFITMQEDHCHALLNTSDLMSRYRDFDLIITDRMSSCASLLDQKLNLPNVLVSSGGFLNHRGALGNPFPLSYVPMEGTTFTPDMTLKERFINCFVYFMSEIMIRIFFDSVVEKLSRHYNISTHLRGVDFDYTPSLVLIPADFALEYPRPVLPNVKVIGPLTAQPASPLPEAFKNLVSGQQVVLISFGTVLGSISDEQANILIEAFNRLPYLFIWKTKNTKLKVGNNVKLVTWFPQNDLLGHNNTVAFFSHCGHNSMYEAAYHGVPIVGLPVFGDQPFNLQQVKRAGMAIGLDIANLTVDSITDAITTVVTDDRYRVHAKDVSVILKSRPRTPRQTAADWVEYVLASHGAQHLRIEGYNLNFIQFYLIDVLLVLLLIIYLSVKIVQLTCCRCCGSRSKVKND